MKTAFSIDQLTKGYHLGVIVTGTLSLDRVRWWVRLRKLPDPFTRIGQQVPCKQIGESILAYCKVFSM